MLLFQLTLFMAFLINLCGTRLNSLNIGIKNKKEPEGVYIIPIKTKQIYNTQQIQKDAKVRAISIRMSKE